MLATDPFVIFALPRSRTAWLARFLTYGDYICGHEELRHARSLEDVAALFSQPCIGSAETSGAPWWRMLDKFAPGAKVLVVRRPVEGVVDSLMALPGIVFDRAVLERAMTSLDRKLDQIEARVDCLSVNYADLNTEATCQAVFEHCLPYAFDRLHWASLAAVNVQCNMQAMVRHCEAFRPAMEKLAAIAKHRTLTAMALRETAAPDGVTLQTESFDAWVRDARPLFNEHLVQVGETPGNWQHKNIPLMRRIYDLGAMQIMTARCNGKMFGYLMTLISPSLTSEGTTTASNTTFFASPAFPGLGMKLQRAALAALKERGVDEVFMQAGVRGAGDRIGAIYKRLGAEDNGQVFRLQLAA